MTYDALRADLARLVAEEPADELPALIGGLEAAKAAAWARLVAPAANGHGPALATADPREEMLTPEQAAAAIGGVSLKWLYRHTKGLRFRRDLSRKVVRFERSGLLRWMAAKRA
jgi:hypothetical protein